MLVAITGAAGFLGSHIARELAGAGHTLRALVRETSDTKELESLGAEIVTGQLDGADDQARLVAGADAVIHNGYFHDTNEVQDPAKFFTVNTLGSIAMIERARQAGAGQFVFISSCSAYGSPPGDPVDEDRVCRPSGGYAAFKAAVDAYIYAYWREFQFRTCSVRPGWIYGPRPKTGAMVWSGVARDVLAGGRAEVSGANSMVHAADAAAAVALVLEKPDECAGEVYNCVQGGLVPTADVARILKEICGSEAEIVETEGSPPVEFTNAKIVALGAAFRGMDGVRAHCEDLVSRLRG